MVRMRGEGPASPVESDEAEHAVFDLVPFRGAGRVVAYGDGQAGFGGQSSEVGLPRSNAVSVGGRRASAVIRSRVASPKTVLAASGAMARWRVLDVGGDTVGGVGGVQHLLDEFPPLRRLKGLYDAHG